MRTFILAFALFGSCLAVDYEIPSGKVSYTSSVPAEGVYGQNYAYGSAFKYGQGVKSVYGVQQPVVKSVVSDAVHDVYPAVQKVYGVQPVHEHYSGYVHPSVRYNVPSKVVKPVVPYVHPVETRQFQPVVHHVSPAVTYPKVQHTYPVVQHSYIQPVEQVVPYGHSVENVVKPFAKFVSPVVQPFKYSHVSPVARIGHVEPVVPAVKYTSPVVQPAHFRHATPVVQPTHFRQVAPVYHQHEVVAKTHEAPAAIVAQSHDSTVDGSFVSNFQTENGIQSTVHGSVKPVVGSDEPAQVMTGSYSYTAPDGTPVVTTWYADENGFHADGDHIPAVPEEIQRSLEYVHSYPVSHEEVKYVKQY